MLDRTIFIIFLNSSCILYPVITVNDEFCNNPCFLISVFCLNCLNWNSLCVYQSHFKKMEVLVFNWSFPENFQKIFLYRYWWLKKNVLIDFAKNFKRILLRTKQEKFTKSLDYWNFKLTNMVSLKLTALQIHWNSSDKWSFFKSFPWSVQENFKG